MHTTFARITYWSPQGYKEYPVALMILETTTGRKIEPETEHYITLILADEAEVNITFPPPFNPDKVDLKEGTIGKWGELKKKFHIENLTEEHPEDSFVEVLSKGNVWLCSASQIEDAVRELQDRIRRRNRQIKDFREESQKLRGKLAALRKEE